VDILENLGANHEWLFSGGGVVVLTAIAALVWKKTFGRANERAQTPTIVVQMPSTPNQVTSPAPALPHQGPPAHITNLSPITLEEITNAIAGAPPLHQEDVAKNYVGLYVQWDTKLWNAEKEDKDSVRLALHFGLGSAHVVFCRVRLSDYKELGILPKHAPITVIGRIQKAALGSATLEDVQLLFHQAKTS
jgi:hypothetical protein